MSAAPAPSVRLRCVAIRSDSLPPPVAEQLPGRIGPALEPATRPCFDRSASREVPVQGLSTALFGSAFAPGPTDHDPFETCAAKLWRGGRYRKDSDSRLETRIMSQRWNQMASRKRNHFAHPACACPEARRRRCSAALLRRLYVRSAVILAPTLLITFFTTPLHQQRSFSRF